MIIEIIEKIPLLLFFMEKMSIIYRLQVPYFNNNYSFTFYYITLKQNSRL